MTSGSDWSFIVGTDAVDDDLLLWLLSFGLEGSYTIRDLGLCTCSRILGALTRYRRTTTSFRSRRIFSLDHRDHCSLLLVLSPSENLLESVIAVVPLFRATDRDGCPNEEYCNGDDNEVGKHWGRGIIRRYWWHLISKRILCKLYPRQEL